MAPKSLDSNLSNDRSSHDRERDVSNPDSPSELYRTDQGGKNSLEVLNEDSPLLSPQRLDDDENVIRSGTPADLLDYTDEGKEQPSKSVLYLFLLTLSIGG